MKNHKVQIKFFFFVFILVLLMLAGRHFHVDTAKIQKSLSGFPVIYSGILYVTLYVVITFFVFFSKDVFWITGAVLFGPALSTLYISIAEIINACILFNMSRYLGRRFVENSLKGKYRNLDEKLTSLNFFWLFMFRAAPLIPYRFLDLAFGLTKVSFGRYMTAVVLASPVKTFWIQYILAGVGNSVLTNPYVLVDYLSGNKTLFAFSFIYLLLVILVALKIKRKN